jgi:hypothetical protein
VPVLEKYARNLIRKWLFLDRARQSKKIPLNGLCYFAGSSKSNSGNSISCIYSPGVLWRVHTLHIAQFFTDIILAIGCVYRENWGALTIWYLLSIQVEDFLKLIKSIYKELVSIQEEIDLTVSFFWAILQKKNL